MTNHDYTSLSLPAGSGICHGNSRPLALRELKYPKLTIPLRRLTKSRATFELEQLRLESVLYLSAKRWLCPGSRTRVGVLALCHPFSMQHCPSARGNLLPAACSTAETGTGVRRPEGSALSRVSSSGQPTPVTQGLEAAGS